MDLGDADPSSVVSSDMAPVLALAGGGGTPFVLHWDCPELASTQDECQGTKTKLEGLSGGNAVLITSAGHYVVATDRESRSVLGWKIGQRSVEPFDETDPKLPTIDQMARLVATMRNSDIVIGRDLQGQLVSYDPRSGSLRPIAPDHDDMMLAAAGERYIVGRVGLDADREQLFVLRVDGSHVDGSELDEQVDPIPLSTGTIASRIVITPRDEYVAVTFGEGDNARTQVFRASDGHKLQGWTGAMVSGREEAAELAGLRAVSPDGSHLAYRTEQGSLAMRSLDSHSSCLVHSSWNGSSTRLAGFSADGVLYFETDEGPGRSAVNAWTPHRKERRRLSDPDAGYRLSAVPARPAEGDARPWAIGVRDGSFSALQSDREPESLNLDEAVFVPRDDANVWAIHAEKTDGSERVVGLRRIVPRWSDQMRALAFDDPDQPRFVDKDAGESLALALRVFDSTRVCMSTGAPGGWAYSCGTAGDSNFLAAPTTPSSESRSGDGRDNPEVPAVGDAYECGQGTPHYQDDNCGYEVRGCCFDSQLTACGWAGCDPAQCTVTDPTPGGPGSAACLGN